MQFARLNLHDLQRATLDSNQWPSAPEADTLFNDSAGLTLLRGDWGEILVPLAERYLQAVANRNRFAHRYGIELAKATLAAYGQAEEVPARVELAPADVPAVQLSGQSIAEIHGTDPMRPAAGRPGLARARAVPPPDLDELVAEAAPGGRR